MKYLYLFTFSILLLLIAACAAEPTAVTPPIVAVHTATAVPPTATASSTATTAPTAASESASAPPTVTPLPSATTILPTPTHTPIPENPISSISFTPVISGGLVMPLGIVHAGDERLFVIQQNGLVSVVENGRLLPEPFLNIRSKLPELPGNEQGLLSLVFHPNYATSGYFYVNYNDVNGDTIIARYSVSSNPNQADPASEQILLTFDQPFINHNGGQLAFGPDGYLYIGVGDGGDQGDPYNNGQKLDSLLGKILRIDVDVPDAPYGIPADNPFVNDENARNEIWAYGLRNPWRFSFDRLTGDLFIADVGQNLYEEVNFQPANSLGGENYGWRPMEASHCYESNCNPEGKVLPIFEYDHTLGCSITGGYVYRGQEYLEMYGNYILADFCVGRVWRLFPNGDGTWDSAIIAENVGPITSFGEDVHGELYALNRAGILLRVRP